MLVGAFCWIAVRDDTLSSAPVHSQAIRVAASRLQIPRDTIAPSPLTRDMAARVRRPAVAPPKIIMVFARGNPAFAVAMILRGMWRDCRPLVFRTEVRIIVQQAIDSAPGNA